MSMPKVGDKAPDFEAEVDGGGKINLMDVLKEKSVVLYFYPKDDTPGCTREACSFRDNIGELEKLGVQILGVSTDSVKSHDKFRDKYKLNFPLVSDSAREIVKDYGVGRESRSAKRVTFLIDRSGIVRYVWDKVDVDRHSEEVIEKIKELGLA